MGGFTPFKPGEVNLDGVTPWSEISSKLDPMLPQAQYDAMREHYFHNVVAPRLKEAGGYSVEGAYADFKSKTERKPLLQGHERITTPVALAGVSAAKELVAPATAMFSGAKEAYNALDAKEKALTQVLDREGISSSAPAIVGAIVGAGVPIAALMAASGPAAGAMAARAFSSARAVTFAEKALRGGMAFGAFEALREQDDDKRMMAGLQGAGMGLAWEAGLSFLSRTKVPNAEKIAKDLMAGKKPVTSAELKVDEALKSEVEAGAQIAKREGREVESTISKQFDQADIMLTKGQGINKKVVTLDAKEHDPDVLYGKVQDMLDAGWEVRGVNFHENQLERLTEFKKRMRGGLENKYTQVAIPAGDAAPAVAEQLKAQGVTSAEAKGGRVVANSAISSGTWRSQPPDSAVHMFLKDKARDTGVAIDLDTQQALHVNVRNAWNVNIDPEVRAEARAYLEEHAPNFVPPEAPKLLRQTAKRGSGYELNDVPLPKDLVETKEIPPFADIESAVRARVQQQGVWDPTTNTPLARSGILFHANQVWNPAAPLKLRVDAWRKLSNTLPEILPDKFPNLAPELRDRLVIPEEKLAVPLFESQKREIDKALRKQMKASETSQENKEAIEHLVGRSVDEDELLDFIAKEQGESRIPATELAPEKGFGNVAYPGASQIPQPPALTTIAKPRGRKASGELSSPPTPIEKSVEDPDVQFSLASAIQNRSLTRRKAVEVADRPLLYRGEGYLGEVPPSTKAVSYPYADRYSVKLDAKPLIIAPKGGWTPRLLYHETMHAMNNILGVDFTETVPSGARSTAVGIARGLQEYGYKDVASPRILLDEAFTHAAEAVRLGDKSYLVQLGKWDAGVKNVLQFVHDTATAIDEHATSLKLDSVATRRAQRVMSDLKRRTDPNVMHMIDQAQMTGHVRFNAADKTWEEIIPTGDGSFTRKVHGSVEQMWDSFLDRDVSDMAPSLSYALEVKGMRGPIVPRGMEPRGKGSLADIPLDPKWAQANWGWQALRGWFRPFFSWVATVDQKANDFYALKGMHIPLYDTVRKVDQQYAAGMEWLAKHQGTLAGDPVKRTPGILKEMTSVKQKDIFQYLTYEPEDRAAAAIALKMTAKDLQAAEGMDTWMKEFRGETGIDGRDFLRRIYPKLRDNAWNPDSVPGWTTRYDPKSAGLFEKAIREDMTLDPQDGHVGRFAKWLMQQGLDKKFTGDSIKELNKLVNRQSEDGRYILGPLRGPLNNYVNYMKGFPDQSQQALNYAIGNFTQSVGKQLEKVNAHLPDGMKIDTKFAPPQQLMNRFLLFSYAAGLGFRVGANVRDALQIFTTSLPVLGPTRFFGAMAKIFSDRGATWQAADQAGALLGRHNVGELFGDIISELPPSGKGFFDRMARFNQKLLQPQRWTDNFGRAITFTAERDAALDAIKKFRAGQIDAHGLMHETSLWWNDAPNVSQLLELAQRPFAPDPVERIAKPLLRRTPDPTRPAPLPEKPDIPTMTFKGITAASEEEYVAKVADKFGRELLDLVHWPYRRGGQPAVLKTGLGRVFGQYGMWPMNYMDFMRRGAEKMLDSDTRKRTAQSIALWGAVNYAGLKAFEGLGADASQWFGAAPSGYAGGPHLQFIQDLMKAPVESDEGRAARGRVLQYPLNYLPGNALMHNLLRNMDNKTEQQGLFTPQVIRAMGLRPLDKPKEFDSIMEELGWETGLKGARRMK